MREASIVTRQEPKPSGSPQAGPTTALGRMASELLHKRPGALNSMAALGQSMRDTRRMGSFLEKNFPQPKRDGDG